MPNWMPGAEEEPHTNAEIAAALRKMAANATVLADKLDPPTAG